MRYFRAIWLGTVFCLAAMAARIAPAQSSQSSLPSAPGQLSAIEQAEEERLAPREAAKRDALLAPGLDDLTHGNYAAAYEKLHTVVVLYPDDLSVLRPSAAAAMGSGHYQEALEMFRHVLLQRPHQQWPIRQAIIILEARLNLWNDFDRDVAALRLAPGEEERDGPRSGRELRICDRRVRQHCREGAGGDLSAAGRAIPHALSVPAAGGGGDQTFNAGQLIQQRGLPQRRLPTVDGRGVGRG
jgi:tetratricopeptide (TPR) repeat protein